MKNHHRFIGVILLLGLPFWPLHFFDQFLFPLKSSFSRLNVCSVNIIDLTYIVSQPWLCSRNIWTYYRLFHWSIASPLTLFKLITEKVWGNVHSHFHGILLKAMVFSWMAIIILSFIRWSTIFIIFYETNVTIRSTLPHPLTFVGKRIGLQIFLFSFP